MKPNTVDAGALLFIGEPGLVDPLVHAAVDAALGTSAQSLDFEIFRHGERPLADVEAALAQVGMFATRRCVWLRGLRVAKRGARGDAEADEGEDAEDEAGEETDRLLELLEAGLSPSTLLFVSTASLDARGRLFKWFDKRGAVRDMRMEDRSGKLDATKLRAIVEERLRDAGLVSAGPGVLDEILRRGGSNVGELQQELDRLLLSLDDPSRLTVAQVKAGMRDLAQAWVFDLTDAISGRNLAAAEVIVERLLAEGDPPLRLVALLGGHAAALLEARGAVDHLPASALGMRGQDFFRGPWTGLPEGFRRRFPQWRGYFLLKAARNFSLTELRDLHAGIVELDLSLKSSRTAPLLLFSRLLQASCAGAPAQARAGQDR